MIVFKNWSIETKTSTEYQAPELGESLLYGNVYGHPNFNDGDFIHSSNVVMVEDMGDHKDIITRSGSRYSVFEADVNKGAEDLFPGYYGRLKGGIEDDNSTSNKE